MQNSPSSPPVRPVFGLALGILAVSTAAIFIRFAQDDAPSLVIAAYRLGLSALVLAPLALVRRKSELRSLQRSELGLALLSGVFLALHFAAWITSLEYTNVASSVVLVTTTPLWVALFSPFTIKESLSSRVKAGMVLALFGGAIVGLSDGCTWSAGRLACPSPAELFAGDAFLGDLLALAGAILAACYLLIGRRLRARTSLLSYITLVYGMAALVLLGLVLAARQPLVGYSPQTYLWFALLALVPQLLGHSIFNWALRYLPAAYVAVTLLGEPVGSTVLAYFLLEETPTALKLFGAILILIGIYVASSREAKRVKLEPET